MFFVFVFVSSFFRGLLRTHLRLASVDSERDSVLIGSSSVEALGHHEGPVLLVHRTGKRALRAKRLEVGVGFVCVFFLGKGK